MANKKISQLTAAVTPLTGTELLPVVQGGVTLQTTAQDIADLGGGGTLPVLNTYPVTTPGSAGTRFWYKGNEWHYMTQDEIDSTGWTGLVSVGFPAPVNKNLNRYIYFSDVDFVGGVNLVVADALTSTIVDFIGFGLPNKIRRIVSSSDGSSFLPYGITITEFKNANLLSELENLGTTDALRFVNNGLTALVIDDLFTQLPLTTKTVTINVTTNPGAATCDPTIATAKGYTVVTA